MRSSSGPGGQSPGTQAATGGAMARRLAGNIGRVAAVRFFFWMHLFAAVIVSFFRDWAGLSFTALLQHSSGALECRWRRSVWYTPP